MSFRSVVNGECFEEASFNNTLSDSFQEPAVSNMSVAMVTAACLCCASHICVFHGPPSFLLMKGLEKYSPLGTIEALALHWKLHPQHFILLGLLETKLQRVSLHTSYERKKSVKLKGDETSAPPDLTEQPAPSVSSTELSPIYRVSLEIAKPWWRHRSCCSLPSFPHSFGKGGLRTWETCF